MLLILVAGSAVSAGFAREVDLAERRYATQLVDRYTEDVAETILDKAGRYGDTLSDLAAAAGSQSDLTAADFSDMTARLDAERLPGAGGVIFVAPASDAEVPAAQTFWRSRGEPGLRLAPVGTGLEHQFVVFDRTFTGDAGSHGRDLSQVVEAREALHRARDSGAVTISRTYVLLTDRSLPAADRQMAFLLAAPVHADGGATFRGWVVMGVRGGDFLDQSLRSRSHGAVQVDLQDPSGGAAATIARVSGGTRMQVDALHRERTLSVGQHTWRLLVFPTTRLLSATDRRMGQLVLVAGISATLLLAALVGVLAGGRNRAMTRVEQATAELRQDIERRQAVEARLREREDELQHMAFHDPLTGLANRILFHDRVGHALLTHGRTGQTFAVLFIDLDGFKQVNDRLGHSAGDTVLQVVAERLRECLRSGDTVARFGGDEFAVITEGLDSTDEVHVTARRIVAELQRPCDIGDDRAVVSASVGIALNRPGAGADDILREADVAMYVAKANGKGRYVLADAAQGRAVAEFGAGGPGPSLL